MSNYTCVLCKKIYEGYGNNAEPITKGQCCDECNRRFIIPFRFVFFRHIEPQNSSKK
jgi:DNA-directed RNA polymerase subunit RPC12/RpoP